MKWSLTKHTNTLLTTIDWATEKKERGDYTCLHRTCTLWFMCTTHYWQLATINMHWCQWPVWSAQQQWSWSCVLEEPAWQWHHLIAETVAEGWEGHSGGEVEVRNERTTYFGWRCRSTWPDTLECVPENHQSSSAQLMPQNNKLMPIKESTCVCVLLSCAMHTTGYKCHQQQQL